MATLVYSEGGGASSHFQLHSSPILIGAAAECAIRARGPLLEPKHARLYERDGEYWIEDLGSESGVFVGDQRVSETRLQFGEVVVVGSLMLRLDDSGDGAPIFTEELLQMLAASGQRQKQLEDERNALGQRVGELHQELAAAKEHGGSEAAQPTANLDSGSLEKLAAELQAAEKARRDLEAKINRAQRKRARTQSEITAAEASDLGSNDAEMEIKQVQLLALQAQAAEADKNVSRLRKQLSTRNQEIAALRSRALKQTGGAPIPKTTQPYTVPDVDGDSATDEKVAELKQRFETQFERAVTLQRKLKTAESRLKEAEAKAAAVATLAAQVKQLEATNEKLSVDLSKASTELEDTRNAEPPKADTSELEKLRRKEGDLKVLLEGAKREMSSLRTTLNAARDDGKKSAAELKVLKGELEASAATGLKQAEKMIEEGAKLEEKTAEAARKDRELDEMATTVSLAKEKSAAADKIEKQLATLENDLGTVRSALTKSEAAKDAALAVRRELEARSISAKSQTDENRAKLEHAERRASEIQAARESAERALEGAQKELAVARDARLAAEEALSGGEPAREDTAVISLKRRISENHEEASAEIDRLTDRLREIETDLDRALDAEQAALARADAEGAAVAAQIDALTGERDRLASDRDELSEENEAIRKQRDQARRDRDKATTKLTETTAALEAAHTDARALSEALERTKASSPTDTQRDAGAGPTEELRARVIELASQNASLSSEISALSEKNSELLEQLRVARRELDATTSARAALTDSHHELTRRFEAISQTEQSRGEEMEGLLRECHALRDQVSAYEASLDIENTTTSVRVDTFSDLDESTTPGEPAPAVVESLTNLGAAISELRKQMRAASDEAAVMDGNPDSLDVINSALSAAVERVEAARDAFRRLGELVGIER